VSAGCGDCCGPRDLSTVSRAYRRALIIVIILNLGTGAAELVAGFVGQSQSLKADSLDFIGDGLITLLGFAALGRSKPWRARAALIQGVFLALMGLAVVVGAVYRACLPVLPDATTMGLFGALGLAANLASAGALFPHRKGDAGTRAIWLFSRNDALNNLAVVAAAGMVAWSGYSWPDIVAAMAMGALFMHSALGIIRDSRNELAETSIAKSS
jgi:Co/Zn/Cd efflux system component